MSVAYFPTSAFESTALYISIDWSVLHLTVDHATLASDAVTGLWRNDQGQVRQVAPPLILHHLARDSIRWSPGQFRHAPHYFLVERRFGRVDQGLLVDVYVGLRVARETETDVHFEAYDQLLVTRAVDIEGLHHLQIPSIVRPHPLDYIRRSSAANTDIMTNQAVIQTTSLRYILPRTWENYGVPTTWEGWDDTLPLDYGSHPLHYFFATNRQDLEGVHPNALSLFGDVLDDDFGTPYYGPIAFDGHDENVPPVHYPPGHQQGRRPARTRPHPRPASPSSTEGSLPGLLPPTPVVHRTRVNTPAPVRHGSPSAMDQLAYAAHLEANGWLRDDNYLAPGRNTTPVVNHQPNTALWYQADTGAWTYDVRHAFDDADWGSEIWEQFAAALGPTPAWEMIRREHTPVENPTGVVRSSATPPPTLFPQRRPLRDITIDMSPDRTSRPRTYVAPYDPNGARTLRGPASPDGVLLDTPHVRGLLITPPRLPSLTPPPRIDTPHPSTGVVTGDAMEWFDRVAPAPIASPIGRAILAGAVDPPPGTEGPSLPSYEEWFGLPDPVEVATLAARLEEQRQSIADAEEVEIQRRLTRFASDVAHANAAHAAATSAAYSALHDDVPDIQMREPSPTTRAFLESVGMVERADGMPSAHADEWQDYESATTSSSSSSPASFHTASGALAPAAYEASPRSPTRSDFDWFVDHTERDAAEVAHQAWLLDDDSEARFHDGPSTSGSWGFQNGGDWQWSADESDSNWNAVPQSEEPW